MVTFADFGLSTSVLTALAEMGFEAPTPIQATALPLLLAGADLIGQAQTGTGKTAAFGIPLVEAGAKGKASLVLVPTRELAQQVAIEVDTLGRHAGVRALAVYGGTPLGAQVRDLRRGDRAVVVATPGRLLDLLDRGAIDLGRMALVVLDEADEMLKMGFIDEVERVLDAVGAERQTMLFSATIPPPVLRLAERYLREPEFVQAARAEEAPGTSHFAVQVRAKDKVDALVRLLAVERPTGTLVFRHTRESVDQLVEDLGVRGIPAAGLHGGMAQSGREAVLERLRRGTVKVVVATGVAARGLDVDTVSHVVNFDVPGEPGDYVHRVGRTGRAGRSGRSFLFVTPYERPRLRGIEQAVGRLDEYAVPTDRQVQKAVARNLAEWVVTLPAEVEAHHLDAVDEAVAAGGDLRLLAAGALRAAARSHGVDMPPLEARVQERPPPAQGPPAAAVGPRVALTINIGLESGLRPGDVVGALANEGGLAASDIGRIDILPRMCAVEVPAAKVEAVMHELRDTRIRGRGVAMRVAETWEFRGPRRASPDRAPPRDRAGRPSRRRA